MGQSPGDRERKWTLRLAVMAVALAFVVGLVAENFVFVEVRLVVADVEVRLAWALLTACLVGVVVGLLLPRLWR